MMQKIRVAMILGVAVAVAISATAQSAAAGTMGTAQETSPAVVAVDNQPSVEELTKLFDVMRVKQQMQSMRQMLPGMVTQQITAAMKQTEANLPAGATLTPDQREGMEKIMSKYVAKSMDLYPADEMLTDMGAIYQRHLSKEDVDGLIVFYGSPVGRHLLDAQPAIAQEYMPMMMAKVTGRSQAMTKEMMKEMAAFGPSKQAATKQGTAKPPAK